MFRSAVAGSVVPGVHTGVITLCAFAAYQAASPIGSFPAGQAGTPDRELWPGPAQQVNVDLCTGGVWQVHAVDVVRERTDVSLDWQELRDESNYLGSAQLFIDQVLREAGETVRGR